MQETSVILPNINRLISRLFEGDRILLKKAVMYDNLENFSSTEVLEEICRERGLKKKSLCAMQIPASPNPLNTVRFSTDKPHSEASSDTDNCVRQSYFSKEDVEL